MSINEKWKRQKTFGKQIMNASHKASYYKYPELGSVRLLFELMHDSTQYNHHMESSVARVTSRLAWASSAPAQELKQRARELLIGVSPTGALGNKLPFIMSLPERFVAAKAWEARRSRTERKLFETLQQEVADALSSSHKVEPNRSWTRLFLEKRASFGFASDVEGAFAVGMHGIAGALTIAAPMQSFCLALCHYPQYQHMLHEEVDRILGDARMPTLQDIPDMPVLHAFIRETLRWRPPVPTSIPHELTQDDVYDGYHIPKGSVVHALEWSISRDPQVFPEPDAWNPTRWLNPEFPTYLEPLCQFSTITDYSQFGYGDRKCQGMGVTEASLFVGLGSIAWLFSINASTTAIEDRGVQAKPTAPVLGDSPEHTDLHTAIPLTADEALVTDDLLDSKNGENVKLIAERAGTMPTTCTSAPVQSPDGTYDADPTMSFSTLLIAKPLPIKFDMSVRSQKRAEVVLKRWIDLELQGEFERDKVYWKDGNASDTQYGWGRVFS
ncbi:hypothetical protein LTR49_027438 [Elasticomyces elasticus]|nr:hypothetical protein LTR49_027438 [Elasticomyces elasticus]